MFVGRAHLLALIDQLTKPAAGHQGTPPVLVLEGYGGSGRTSILAEAQANWRKRTPSVLVQPPLHGDTEHIPIRPLLALVMLGLSVGVPGYPVTFPRSLIAQIVINANFGGLPHDQARIQLRELLTSYRKRPVLVAFLHQLVDAALTFARIQVPSLPNTPDATKGLVDAIIGKLFRSLPMARFTWGDAPAWFGHQDQGFADDHEETLIQLSDQASNTVIANRHGVDDLLVAAMLADLRHSRARVKGRPPNVLVLLDDGDTPRATSFIRSLLRVRQALEDAGHNRLADPLAVVTTSAGPLPESLKAMTPASVWDGAGPASGAWLRVGVDDLTSDEVRQLARNLDRFTPGRTGAAAYRLTRGHPEATKLVLAKFKRNGELVEDLDRLLGEPEPDEGERPVDHHLLQLFVRGLSPHKHVDENTVDALITVSAARNWREASGLTKLLPRPLQIGSELFTSPTLWSSDGEHRHLHPLARYLGLRALAARTDPRTGWEGVFRQLRARIDPDDRAARLHHERMLNGKGAIAGELADLLPELPAQEWLDLFDAVVATPDPREREDMDSVKGIGQPPTPLGHTMTVLGVVPALEKDPCVAKASDIDALRKLAWFSFLQLAGSDGVRDKQPFIDRATRYAQDGPWCW